MYLLNLYLKQECNQIGRILLVPKKYHFQANPLVCPLQRNQTEENICFWWQADCIRLYQIVYDSCTVDTILEDLSVYHVCQAFHAFYDRSIWNRMTWLVFHLYGHSHPWYYLLRFPGSLKLKYVLLWCSD